MKKITELNIKGAIFDMDGVILNSMLFWRNFPTLYLNTLGIEAPADILSEVYELSIEECFAYMKKKFNIQKPDHEIIKESMVFIHKFYAEEVELKPGVIDTLKKLKEMNIPIILATSSHREQVAAAFNHLGISDYFQQIFTSFETGSSKHDPEIYHLAAKAIGSEPANTLVFEDTLYALQTATKAGFVTIGLYDEVSEAFQEELKADACYYLKSMEDFNSIL